MNVAGTNSAISSAIASAATSNEISMAVAGKALDAQKQEGAAALALISAATGKGKNVNALA